MKDITNITSKQVLSWAKRIEAQCSQKTMVVSLKETNDHEMIRRESEHQNKFKI